jgi:hypothetical protein
LSNLTIQPDFKYFKYLLLYTNLLKMNGFKNSFFKASYNSGKSYFGKSFFNNKSSVKYMNNFNKFTNSGKYISYSNQFFMSDILFFTNIQSANRIENARCNSDLTVCEENSVNGNKNINKCTSDLDVLLNELCMLAEESKWSHQRLACVETMDISTTKITK